MTDVSPRHALRFDTLAAWLAWLETLHPKAIDMGLERVRCVAARLNLLSSGVPVVTVAGTNGKGSVTAMLEALLLAHGKHVGCYTSPHILRFNERIRIDGHEVDDAGLIAALAEVDAARGAVSLTYFEFTTLAALLIFHRLKLDAWVLEVGLGGRLDAVNVLDADVAVLTSVGLDHQEWLGDTREAIGREKAGIFRPGKPAVIGEPDLPGTVPEVAAGCHAMLVRTGTDFLFSRHGDDSRWQWAGRDVTGAVRAFDRLPVPALAMQNAATALQAFCLLPFAVDAGRVGEALARVQLAGRNQRLEAGGRQVIVDVGHNADALQFLRGEIERHQCGMRFHIVLGMLADKDIEAAVRVLEPLGQSWHIAPLPSPRSATASHIQGVLERVGVTAVQSHFSIADALSAALSADDEVPVLVTGSFYAVAAAMTALAETASL